MKSVIVQLLVLATFVSVAGSTRLDITEYIACSAECKHHYSVCIIGSRQHYSIRSTIDMEKVCQQIFRSCIQKCMDENMSIIHRNDVRHTLPSRRVTQRSTTASE